MSQLDYPIFNLKYSENKIQKSKLDIMKRSFSPAPINMQSSEEKILEKFNNLNGVLIKIDRKTCFLTCYRYIKNKKNIYFENDFCQYISIYKIIKELDLVLIDVSPIVNNNNIIYRKSLNKIINGDCIVITNDNQNINFIDFSESNIVFDTINTSHIPKIPLIKINNKNKIISKKLKGGDLVLQDNKPIGIVSYIKNDHVFSVPFFVIYYFFELLQFDENKFAIIMNYIIPSSSAQISDGDNCYIVDKTTNITYKTTESDIKFNENDLIIKVNDLDFNNNGELYFDEFDINIEFELYLFLMATQYNNMKITYYNYDNNTGEHNEEIKTCVLNEPVIYQKYITTNIYNDNENVKIYCASFSELSEEYLIDMMCKGIEFAKEYYEKNINITGKKHVFLNRVEYDNITKNSVKFARYLNNINAPFVDESNNKYKLLIVEHVNFKKVNNLIELKKIINEEKCVKTIGFRYLCSDNIFVVDI